MSGTIVATLVARARQRIVTHFTSAGATHKGFTVAYPRPEQRIERRVFDRMVAFGALVEGPVGQYWLDEKQLSNFKKESLARVLSILAVAGFAAAGVIAAS